MRFPKLHILLPALLVSLAGVSFAETPKPAPSIPDGIELQRDVEYGTGGGRALHMHIAHPKAESKTPMPVFVFIHGGGWQKGNADAGIALITAMAQQGYFGASIDYRLSQEAKFPAQIEDSKCAIRFLRAHAEKYHIDPDRIGVMGSSAGGHLVALLGTAANAKELEGAGGWDKFSSRVQAVCDLFGPSDLVAFLQDPNVNPRGVEAISGLLGVSFQDPAAHNAANFAKAKSASPVTYVGKDAAPFLIMHGDEDKLVPPAQSDELTAALKKAGIEATLEVIKGSGHGGPGFSTPEARAKVADFFNKHLKSAAAPK